MGRLVGAVAAGLGHLIRLLLLALPALVRTVAFASLVYGIALFDPRVAWIVGGALVLLFMLPQRRETR